MFLKLLLLLLSFVYTSCTTPLVVKQPSCTQLNWFELGRQDGMQGQPSNNWFLQAKQCEKMGPSEVQNYMDGWNHGLAMFCTEEHGFITARSGAPYKKTCPEKYEEAFLKGYQEGFSVHMIEKETAQIISQVESMEEKLKDDETDAANKEQLQKTISTLNEKKLSNLRTLEKYNTAVQR